MVLDQNNPTKAARKAGYAQPKQRAYELLRKGHVLEAVRQKQKAKLDGDLTNVALETLRDVMVSDESSASAKVSASRAVLEAAGYFKHDKTDEEDWRDKDITEMTQQELKAYVREARAELKVVT